jgi:heme A synthase
VKLEEDILKVLLHWFLFLGLLHEMPFSLVFFIIFLFADMLSDLKSL